MKKKTIIIKKAFIEEDRLNLETREPIADLIPAEQILVNSEQFSFIYLMEDQTDYTYIEIPESIWPSLKAAKDKEIPVWIKYQNEQIELVNFQDELDYIVSNIEGNSNYGHELVAKVESIFLS